MRHLKFVACACLGVLFGAATAAGAKVESLSASATAALRTHAQGRIVELLERRAVRQIDPGIIASDARRLASRLDEAQLRAMAAGDDIAEVVDQAMQVRSASAPLLGSPTTDLVFVPLAPCRIIDTRVAGGGRLQPGVVRDFRVAGTTEFGAQGGTLGGCGVPLGSTEPQAPSVVINFIAVSPSGPGNLRAWAWGQPIPNASVLNYAAVPGLNIANGVVVPIAGIDVPDDLHIQADVNGTHVVADVMGYFTRFTIEDFADTEKSITVVSDAGSFDLSAGTCTQVNSCTINASSDGQVIVRVWAQVKIDHSTNVGGDRIVMGVNNNCPTTDQSINATDFEVPDALPADSDVDTTLSHKRIFTQGNGSKDYVINARMITGAGVGDVIESSRMICTFIPDGAP